VYFQGRV